ncbi:MAG TPA: M1 family aminopeptidase [Solirubrobacterales bacterium]
MSRSLAAMRRYAGIVIALIAALAVIVPTALAQSDAPAQTAPVASVAADVDGPLLAVTSVSSAPAGAGTGDSFVLNGMVANSGHEDGDGEIVVNLIGSHQPLVVGRTSAEVPAGAALTYSTEVSVPKGIADGSYRLVACIQRADVAGELGCATAYDHLVVGQAGAVRGPATRAAMARRVDPDPTCTPGARTLSKPGDHVYPDQGNGGYTSLHTDVNLIFDGVSSEFLPGTNVVLTDRAEECLSEFSLDFARSTPSKAATQTEIEQPGADMEVESVTVNGVAATFRFAQPTFPGNPNGNDDPNPLAHQAGQDTPVSATNPNPPACSPVGGNDAAIGQPCAANKLVITPAQPIQIGEEFDVKVNYSGEPGVFTDGDGSVEGWFRSQTPDGIDNIVVTEPVGGLAWMPLNNHPTAKPTYDFTEKVTAGMTAIANGELVSQTANPAEADFPEGSTTWVWHSPEPIASYLVASSIVNFEQTTRLGDDGTVYTVAETPLATAANAATNKAVIATHEEVSALQERFNGPYPFTTNGIVVGINRTFAEEMQTKIAINNGRVRAGTFLHENYHQWWGDNVSESGFNETFFKEGMAEFGGGILLSAREAANTAGGLDTPAGRDAFDQAFRDAFTEIYNRDERSEEELEAEFEAPIRWENAPSDPSPATLFEDGSTYERTAASYIALREILGHDNFSNALKQIQHDFAGGNITEEQAEDVFHGWMPNQSAACDARLDQFFAEWWDTKFALRDGTPTRDRPQLTGPNLRPGETGLTFYNADGSCRANTGPTTTASVVPNPVNGKVTGPATVVLTATDDAPADSIATEYRVDNGGFQPYAGPIVVSALGAHKVEYHSTDRDGAVEPTKQVAFEIVAAPAAPVACAKPQLTVGVTKPLRKKKGVATLRKGKAYRYTGSLTCEVAGKRAPAPEGTAVSISTVKGGKTTRQSGVAVGPDGKIDTLLQFSGKRTVVFGYESAEARIRITTARR